ncbi:MAG: PTS fructose transporter subunit IIA [Sarcina sp.]
MKGIIVTGHGKFAEGIVSAMEVIAGRQKGIEIVNFSMDSSTEKLKKEIREKIDIYNREVLILADLAGGSPFNVSVELMGEIKEKNIEVVAGVNLAMLLELALMKDMETMEELLQSAISVGISAVKKFEVSRNRGEIEIFDEGI